MNKMSQVKEHLSHLNFGVVLIYGLLAVLSVFVLDQVFLALIFLGLGYIIAKTHDKNE